MTDELLNEYDIISARHDYHIGKKKYTKKQNNNEKQKMNRPYD